MKPQLMTVLIAMGFMIGHAQGEPSQTPDPNKDAPTVTRDRQCKDQVRVLSSPEYPRSAIRAGLSRGWVWLRFDLDGSGHASNIQIISSAPKSQFEDFPPSDDTLVRSTRGKRTRLYDQSAVAWLERATFIKGAKRQGCEIVADFLLK